jgi:formate dehydrogenase major subunit
VLYNRASADPDGKPWSERKALVWWDEENAKWTGHDIPDFIANRPPSYRPPPGATGVAAIAGDDPFIMQADGKAWLFTPAGLVDGPMPAHYEPQESPLPNLFYGQQHNPVRQIIRDPQDRFQPSGDEPGSEIFPYVTTTYRLTEHHTAGGMSRYLSHLAELQPEFFCEISPELAKQVGVEHRGWVTIVTARGIVEARAMVTTRMPLIHLNGKTVHQVGLPYHWGYKGLVKGDSANDLLALSEEPNVRIMESKALLCNVFPGRRERGPRALKQLDNAMRQPKRRRMGAQ